ASVGVPAPASASTSGDLVSPVASASTVTSATLFVVAFSVASTSVVVSTAFCSFFFAIAISFQLALDTGTDRPSGRPPGNSRAYAGTSSLRLKDMARQLVG